MTVDVHENPERERYEIHADGELAGFAEYRGGGPLRALTHTEIDPRYEGKGLGGRLISATLDDIRAKGQHVLPICPFVKAFLANHTEYLDLVEPAHRRTFNLPEPT